MRGGVTITFGLSAQNLFHNESFFFWTPLRNFVMLFDMFLVILQTLLISQKMNLRAESKEGRVPDTSCQDHMMGE